MKTLVLASFLLGAWTANEYVLAPKPEADRKIVRSFHFESEMAAEPMEEDEMGGDFEHEMSNTFTCVVTDHLGEVKDGEVQSFVRSFDELGSSVRQFWSAPEMEPEEMEMELASELQGHSVVFALGEEPSWAEGESGDSDLLEDLVQGMSLIELLPEEPVEVGGSWDLDATFLEILGAPGGDLKLMPADAPEGEMGGPEDGEEPEEEFSGKIGATLVRVDEEEGQKLAILALEIDVEANIDLTEMYQSMGGGGDPEEGFIVPDIDSAEVTISKAGKGEAVWDLDAGRLVSLVLDLDVEQIERMEMSFDMGQGPEEFDQENIMVGTENYEVNFDA